MAPQKISPRVTVETEHFGSNNSIIDCGSQLVLIDSPHCLSDARRWRAFAESLGEIAFIVNSDHHPDHTIGNYVMPGWVIGHAITRERLLTEPPSREYLIDLMQRLDPESVPVFESEYQVRVPDICVQDHLELNINDVLVDLRFQRGHTRNNLLTYLPEDRVLFTGDIVCEAGLPSFQDSRMWDWFDALDVVEQYDFDYLVPGHGIVTDRAGVQRYRELGRAVVAEVSELLGKGATSDEVIARVRFEDNIHVATETCVGYSEEVIESFQTRSIERIVEDLHAEPELANR